MSKDFCKICGKKRESNARGWKASLWTAYCPEHVDQAPNYAKKAPWEDIQPDAPPGEKGHAKGNEQDIKVLETKEEQVVREESLLKSIDDFENHPGEIHPFASSLDSNDICYPILARIRKFSGRIESYGLVVHYFLAKDRSPTYVLLEDARMPRQLSYPKDYYRRERQYFFVRNTGARYISVLKSVRKNWWEVWPKRSYSNNFSPRTYKEILADIEDWSAYTTMPVAQTILPNGYIILTAYTLAGFFTRITGTITKTVPSIVRITLSEEEALEAHAAAVNLSKSLSDVSPKALIKWRENRRDTERKLAK